jgi:thiol-disulfide isomerase/thioredoxin
VRRRFALLLLTAMSAVPAFSATLPRPAPELIIDMLDGSKLNINKYKGKVIAVEFLLTGCSHCQDASRTLAKLMKEYGPKGFQPVGGAINDDAPQLLPAFIKDQGVNYPVGLVKREKAMGFLQHSVMMTMSMPQLLFIDRKGIIRAQYGGTSPFFNDEEKNMREQIESLLKESIVAKTPSAAKKGKK